MARKIRGFEGFPFVRVINRNNDRYEKAVKW